MWNDNCKRIINPFYTALLIYIIGIVISRVGKLVISL